MTMQYDLSFRAPMLSGLLLLSGLAAVPARAVSLELGPAVSSAQVGDTFEMILRISGLAAPGAPSLGAFDLNVNFDPSLLSLQSAVFGDPTWGNQLDAGAGTVEGSTPDALLGQVNLFALSLDSSPDLDAFQRAEFTLATLRFSALGQGVAAIDLSDIILSDGEGDSLAVDPSGVARVDLVQPVPDGGMPSSGATIAVAATVLGFLRFRRR